MNKWPKYYDDTAPVTPNAYVSLYGNDDKTSDGTKEKPFPKKHSTENANKYVIAYGSGHEFDWSLTQTGTKYTGTSIGMGMYKTTVFISKYVPGKDAAWDFRNMRIKSDISSIWINTNNCVVDVSVNIGSHKNSILYTEPLNGYFTNCTFVGIDFTQKYQSYSSIAKTVFHDCGIYIGTSVLNQYALFSNCRFKFQNDVQARWFTLEGDTSEKKKADFIAKCNQFGVNNGALKDADISTLIFSDDSVHKDTYEVIPGSSAYRFQENYNVYLGHYNANKKLSNSINITSGISPLSFNNIEGKSSSQIHVDNESITMLGDGIGSNVYTIKSGIIPFSKKGKLSAIDLKAIFGGKVFASTTSPLIKVEDKNVAENIVYMVKTKTLSSASVVYNGITYTSDGNNLFRGVSGVATMEYDPTKAIIYKVSDQANAPTFDVRIGDEPLSGKIGSGKALDAGYWYMVVSDDSENVGGSVEYNGNNYPIGSSFLAKDGKTTFIITGDCHLLKMMADDETIHPFITLTLDNLTVLKDSPFAVNYLYGADNKPIGSGHPEYDTYISNSIGAVAAIPIEGRFMQVRVGINVEK